MTKPPEGIGSLHVLGTDNLGRDVFSRVIYGARVSLLVAFAVVFISGFIGISLGAISGYFGSKPTSRFRSWSRSYGLFHRCCSASRLWPSSAKACSI